MFSSTWTLIAEAQEIRELDLGEAHRLVRLNYPLSDDRLLIEEITNLNLLLIQRNRLPVLTFSAEGKVQSDNVQIGGNDPNFPINVDVPLESYKAYMGLNYNIYDGGLTSAQKKLERASESVNQEALEVNLRTLKDRINQLFFNVELARQQRNILNISLKDIEANIKTAEARVKNGVILLSELNKLKVRQLELLSEQDKLEGDITAFLSILEKLIGSEISTEVLLKFPSVFTLPENVGISRPEQDLFEAQKEVLAAQKELTGVNKKPKLSLFGEGGLGYPNPLNFSDVERSFYGLVGVKLSWNFLDWGKGRKEKDKIDLQIKQTEVDKLTFEFDMRSREQEFIKRIEAVEKQIENGNQIVELQSQILKQTNTQLKNGVINSSDYLEQVNAELRAKQQLKLHEIQLEQLKVEYLTLFGNL
ncbi:MAG: TolC family protein [Balneola sp.]